MSGSTGDHSIGTTDNEAGIQPLRDGDTSIEPDPAADPAQAEWDRRRRSTRAPDRKTSTSGR